MLIQLLKMLLFQRKALIFLFFLHKVTVVKSVDLPFYLPFKVGVCGQVLLPCEKILPQCRLKSRMPRYLLKRSSAHFDK